MDFAKFTVGRMTYKKPSDYFVQDRVGRFVKPYNGFNGVTMKSVPQVSAELEEIALRGTEKDAKRYLKLEGPTYESLISMKENLSSIAEYSDWHIMEKIFKVFKNFK